MIDCIARLVQQRLSPSAMYLKYLHSWSMLPGQSLIDGGVRREDLVSLAPKTGQLEKMMSRGRPAQLRPRGGQSAKQRGKGGATPSRDPKPVARQQRPSQRGESGGSSSNATLEQVEEISGGWTKLKSWSDRCDHLERLTSAVRENPKAVVSKLFVVMDVYSTGVSDGNSKVAALALQSMSRIIPLFGSAIAKVLHLVMPPLCKVAGSSSSQIQELCSDFLDRVASAIPPAQGVVAFTNSVDKSVSRTFDVTVLDLDLSAVDVR